MFCIFSNTLVEFSVIRKRDCLLIMLVNVLFKQILLFKKKINLAKNKVV